MLIEGCWYKIIDLNGWDSKGIYCANPAQCVEAPEEGTFGQYRFEPSPYATTSFFFLGQSDKGESWDAEPICKGNKWI